MKKTIANAICNVGIIAFLLVFAFWFSGKMGLHSHGYSVHFATIDGEFTAVRENWVEILGERYITGVEYN